MMDDSWSYICEKAHELLHGVFLMNGTLAERLQKVRDNRLLYLLGRSPPDEQFKEKFEEMRDRWLNEVEPEMDESDVSDFGRDLLTLIWQIDEKYNESKLKK